MLLLGSAVFILLGAALEWGSSYQMIDFKAIYYGARCVLHHRDPYQESEFLSVYQAEGGSFPSNAAAARSVRQAIPMCINLPSALLLVAPLAAFPWRVAQVIWMLLTAAGLPLAALLIWDVAAQYTARIPAVLAFLILANSELLLVVGNASGIVVSLCAIAVWCLLRERLAWAGILCLAAGLLLKPQDAAFLWLYFLLAGGAHRKRALQAAMVALAIGVVAALWVGHVSPHWMDEMRSNIVATWARGGLNDPGPTSMGAHGLGMVVSLQGFFSVFKDNPRFYNPMAILVSGALLLPWAVKTLRASSTPRIAWFAMATIAALSMLPVYHRAYDARLLLLTLPACAMLWAEHSRLRWWAVCLTGAAILCTGDLFWSVVLIAINNPAVGLARLPAQAVIAVQMFPAPLSLLAVSIFYLWVYLRGAAAANVDT
jgi:hypothetical protein